MNNNPIYEIIGLVILLAIISIIVRIGEAMGWAQFGYFVALLIAAGYVRVWTKPWWETRALRKLTRERQAAAAKSALSYKLFVEKLDKLGISEDRHPVEFGVAQRLAIMEGLLVPQEEPVDIHSIAHGRYRDRLLDCIELGGTKEKYTTFMVDLIRIISFCVETHGEGLFPTEILLSSGEVGAIVEYILDDTDESAFRRVKAQIRKNINLEKCFPEDYDGEDIVDAYFIGTPLQRLKYRSRRIALINRTRHTMILGGSGTGKTNLIEYMIGYDIIEAEEEDGCCIIVIDSQHQLIPKLAKVKLPTENVTYLNPAWDGWGLNLFDVEYDKSDNPVRRETVINNAVGLIRFVLEGALQGGMTDRQRVMFDYAIQLVIQIPHGNMATFIELLGDNGLDPYGRYIEDLDDISQDFFTNDWPSKEYRSTRNAVKTRLQTLLKNPTFKRLFSTTKNNFNAYDDMQSKWLMLLDTDKPLLDKEGSGFLGRLYIAMIMQAAYRRFENADKTYKPVYIYIDEAHEYFDDRLAEMLEQARKANIGLILAHQDIDQIKKKPGLTPATIIGSTATKLVATTYQPDANEMAKSMRVRADDILNLPDFTFALYDRTNGFAPVRAPKDPLTALEKRINLKELESKMRERFSASRFANAQGAKETPASENKNLPGDVEMI